MKKLRHAKIKELIRNNEIGTQEELAVHLTEKGYKITQATVSRDIRELKLFKIASADGKRMIYSFYVTDEDQEYLDEKYINALCNGFVSGEVAGNLVVIKTVAGMAMAVAAAIDSMSWSEVLGSIAGDDTIMVAVRSANDGMVVYRKIMDCLDRV